ncbi:calmodulin-binding transcription activator 2-like [Scyliorhinus canicula]|nr:calmodulin-binding transcription activator 2-like [Scyliorhinus canicula]
MDCLPKCAALPKERQRWNTNEEIASYLTAFEKHDEWLSGAPRTRPVNGSIILYNRKKVKYRKDGYCWKKRKDGKTTREDHMKLKVQGMECLYGCYVHSSIIPTFHRRCYWLLQNPDIVLVHYLNVPVPEDCGKMCGPVLCSVNSDRKEWMKWSREELICQLKPMFHCIKWSCSNGNGATEFSVEQLVHQVLESHQAKPQPRTHTCLCNRGLGTTGSSPHKCNSTKHRIISPKVDIRLTSYSALTEVQNLSGTEIKNEEDDSKSESERKVVKLPKAALQLNGGSREASPPSALESAESEQEAPTARTNGYYDRELTSVAIATTVPNLTVTCSLPQNAVILMTGIGDKPVSLTPSQQLVAANPTSQGLPLSGRDLPLAPPASAIGLALLPSSVGGLIFSQANMDTSEPHAPAFDPDSFLNSPKQGQTYGGGAGARPPGAFPSASLSDSGFPNGDLKEEPDFQSGNLEPAPAAAARSDYRIPPSSRRAPQNSSLVSVTRTFSETAEGSFVTSELSSSPVLEKMDYSNTEPPKNYTSVFGKRTPTCSPLPPSQNRFFIEEGQSNAGAPTASPVLPESLKVEAISQLAQEHGNGASVKEELQPSLPMAAFQAVAPEVEMSVDTAPQLNGDAEMAKAQRNVEMEPAVKSEGQYDGRGRAVDGDGPLSLPCSQVTDLYTIIQNDLSSSSVSSSNIDLNIDHFDISFDSQFPDLMSEFMTDSSTDTAGGFAQYGRSPTPPTPADSPGQTVSPNYPELSSQMGGYCPQQQQQQPEAPRELVSAANDIPFTEVLVTPSDSTQASPGNATGRDQGVTITDFSPEWSYPEGGVKVLITGPWDDGNDRYSCTFDKITVPASLIQPGVLRCYCPAHEAGLVKLLVALANHFLSNWVLFEYRARNSLAMPSSQLDWLSLDGRVEALSMCIPILSVSP